MTRIAFTFATALALVAPLLAQDVDSLADKRVVVLGDSNTQAGGYVALTAYYLDKLYPSKSFDVISLGLASETLSGLSEDGHAGGKFPRPCLFERLGRLLDKAKPEVVFACYGINDGIYQPLDKERFARSISCSRNSGLCEGIPKELVTARSSNDSECVGSLTTAWCSSIVTWSMFGRG